MNEQRIREIANQSSTYAENTVSYYSGTDDGLTWEAKILKARDLKFAELIVRECSKIVEDSTWNLPHGYKAVDQANLVKQHFGVEK